MPRSKLEESKVTDHLRHCARVLRETVRTGVFVRSPLPMREGYEAVLELVEADWNDLPEDLAVWRRGYEQCMIDIAEAIADEWGVALPKAPTPE